MELTTILLVLMGIILAALTTVLVRRIRQYHYTPKRGNEQLQEQVERLMEKARKAGSSGGDGAVSRDTQKKQ